MHLKCANIKISAIDSFKSAMFSLAVYVYAKSSFPSLIYSLVNRSIRTFVCDDDDDDDDDNCYYCCCCYMQDSTKDYMVFGGTRREAEDV